MLSPGCMAGEEEEEQEEEEYKEEEEVEEEEMEEREEDDDKVEEEEEQPLSNFPVRLLTHFKHVSASRTPASLLEHLSRVCRVLSRV